MLPLQRREVPQVLFRDLLASCAERRHGPFEVGRVPEGDRRTCQDHSSSMRTVCTPSVTDTSTMLGSEGRGITLTLPFRSM
jgi:hypothetical protein